jgi:uncharacterized protein
MNPTWMFYGLLGGGLIGTAAGTLLALNGRIAGISGVLGNLLRPQRGDVAWRIAFLAGLLCGGAGLLWLYPQAYPARIDSSALTLVAAGLLVGFGTRLGGGCTSGHGVCGTARLSRRSIAATAVFIATGALTVLAGRVLGS